MIEAFKIRDKETGLFARSGLKFTTIGKVWTTRGQLIAALRYALHYRPLPDNWEIICLTDTKHVNVVEFLLE